MKKIKRLVIAVCVTFTLVRGTCMIYETYNPPSVTYHDYGFTKEEVMDLLEKEAKRKCPNGFFSDQRDVLFQDEISGYDTRKTHTRLRFFEGLEPKKKLIGGTINTRNSTNTTY